MTDTSGQSDSTHFPWVNLAIVVLGGALGGVLAEVLVGAKYLDFGETDGTLMPAFAGWGALCGSVAGTPFGVLAWHFTYDFRRGRWVGLVASLASGTLTVLVIAAHFGTSGSAVFHADP